MADCFNAGLSSERKVPLNQQFNDAILASKPVAYWKLTESSGTTMTDSSGSAHHGVYAGTVALAHAGLVDDDSYSFETSAGFSGTGRGAVAYGSWMNVDRISVEAIIKPSALSGVQVVAERDTNGGVGSTGRVWNLLINGGSLTFQVFTGLNSHVEVATSVAAGVVRYVAGTYDGSVLVLYLDGIAVGQASLVGSVYMIGSQGIVIGNRDALDLSFDGDLEKVALYNRALTAQEIAQHYAALSPGGNQQPMQITSDLTTANSRSYFVAPKG